MAAHLDWVDRRFDFNFPAGLFPEMIERLRGTPARLAERLGPLAPQARTRRDGPDWSMQEHAADMTNRATWEAGSTSGPSRRC